MVELERLDRRAFLGGMMVTSAGLVVPKPVSVFVPERLPRYDVGLDLFVCESAEQASRLLRKFHEYWARRGPLPRFVQTQEATVFNHAGVFMEHGGFKVAYEQS